MNHRSARVQRRLVRQMLDELLADDSQTGRHLWAAAAQLLTARQLLETGQQEAARNKLEEVRGLLLELQPEAEPQTHLELDDLAPQPATVKVTTNG